MRAEEFEELDGGTEVVDGVALALVLAAAAQLFRHRTVRPEGGLYGRIECGGALDPAASAADWCRGANAWAWQSALLLFAAALTIWVLGRWSKVEAVRRSIPALGPRLVAGADGDEFLALGGRSDGEAVTGPGRTERDEVAAGPSPRRPGPRIRRRRPGSATLGARRSRGGPRSSRRGSGASSLRGGTGTPVDRTTSAPSDPHPGGGERKAHPARDARFHPREVRRAKAAAPPARRSSPPRRRPPKG